MADPNNINLQQKKLIKSKSGLKIVLVDEKHQSPFLLDEPSWIPDKEVKNCLNCKVKFNFTIRKHHCRRCGLIFCSDCCSRRVWLPRMCFMDPVRVCSDCAIVSEKERDFFDNYVPTLQNGATFLLNPLNSSSTCLCLCKLSNTQQYLQFDSVVKMSPLAIDSVIEYRILPEDGTGGSSLEITSDSGRIRLTTGPENHRNAGVEWIRAIDRAFRLMNISCKLPW